jgi:hypothetical protein
MGVMAGAVDAAAVIENFSKIRNQKAKACQATICQVSLAIPLLSQTPNGNGC